MAKKFITGISLFAGLALLSVTLYFCRKKRNQELSAE